MTVALLERIAEALERIADALETPPPPAEEPEQDPTPQWMRDEERERGEAT